MTENEVIKFEYKNCFVAFLDILGFRTKVMETKDSSKNLEMLIEALKISGSFPSGGKKVSSEKGENRTISVQTRFFSDTMVLFLQEDPRDLSHLFLMTRYLQDSLWKNGICLRGAITIGDMYWTDDEKDITIGPALIEAYQLESEIAIFPRIIISEGLNNYIDVRNPSSEPFSQNCQLKNMLRLDSDGTYFLDLLNLHITRAKDEHLVSNAGTFTIQWTTNSDSNYENIIQIVDSIIERNRNSKDPKIKQKYRWLENYRDLVSQ
ncbi:MAG: hypothetical protein HQ510_11070 [Candidatus Marinimicrobia bacterium]|nr:hypothetical protein [Candidatus Neomarinimicrobiota bacterium]